MADTSDFPAPDEGFVVTHVLVVSDQDRSRRWYSDVLGARAVLEREPVILRVASTWIVLDDGGGPTEDKPDTALAVPEPGRPVSAFLNIRVADVRRCYEEWRAAGATFLAEPVDWGREIRCSMTDPDGHLIEVGQST